MTEPRLEGIDHVALAVRDVERSSRWYQEVLGLEHRFPGAWDGVPVFLGCGSTNLALFPAAESVLDSSPESAPRWFLHYAFRVATADFESAQQALSERGIPFEFQDHGLARSVYFRDPDGYQLEITTYI